MNRKISSVLISFLIFTSSTIPPSIAVNQSNFPTYSPIVEVAIGEKHGCVLRENGLVDCWEFGNSQGAADVPNNLPLMSSITANFSFHTCGVGVDQKAYCWGSDQAGESAVPNALGTVVEVSTGWIASCAITTDHRLVCWGSSSIANLPVELQSNNVVAISVGKMHACAIYQTDKVLCWGSDSDSRTTIPNTVVGVTSVSAGEAHTCVTTTENKISCWGWDQDNRNYFSSQITNASYVSSGWGTNCALKNDGTVICSRGFVPFVESNFIGIQVGSTLGCGIQSSGFLKCFGQDLLSVPKTYINDLSISSINFEQDGSAARISWVSSTDIVQTISAAFEISEDNGATWNLINSSDVSAIDASSVRIFGLEFETNYKIRMALTLEGEYGPSSSILNLKLEASSPAAPLSVTLSSRTNSSVSISWTEPDDGGLPITSYKYQVSIDDLTWDDPIVTDTTRSLTLSELPSATTVKIRIAAENSNGTGNYSEPFYFSTKGTKQFRVYVSDETSNPIVGGAITWRMTDDSAWSSKTYGLTADGFIDFPVVPAGQVSVSLTDGLMADGTYISGTWVGYLGFSELRLVAANAPVSEKRVTVVVADEATGQLNPVAGAIVNVSDQLPLHDPNVISINAFTYEIKGFESSGVTDSSGTYLSKGFWESPIANVVYDDGVLTQQKTQSLINSNTLIELDYAPYVNVDNVQITSNQGSLVPITIDVISNDNVAPLANSNVSNKEVKLVLPPNAKAKCKGKQILRGSPNANGKVKLKVCASVSGDYMFSGRGILVGGKIEMKVKGSSPTKVHEIVATSDQIGLLNINWKAPVFNGGSKITSYKLVLTAGNKKITKVVKGKRKISITGLKNATTYKIEIIANNKFGKSLGESIYAPVA